MIFSNFLELLPFLNLFYLFLEIFLLFVDSILLSYFPYHLLHLIFQIQALFFKDLLLKYDIYSSILLFFHNFSPYLKKVTFIYPQLHVTYQGDFALFFYNSHLNVLSLF